MAEQRTPLHALPACAARAGTGQRPITHLGFNGELCEPLTGHYLLGNGYRAYNPVLMRFNSPDNLSPFGAGGVNAYAYCLGDPTNRVDPSGHRFLWPSRAVLVKTGSAVAALGFVSTLAAGLAVQDNNLLKAGLIVGSMVLGAVGVVGAFKTGAIGPRDSVSVRASIPRPDVIVPPPPYNQLSPPRYSVAFPEEPPPPAYKDLPLTLQRDIRRTSIQETQL